MKFLICQTILFCILLPVSGQPLVTPIELFQGPSQELPSSSEIPAIFGHDETGYYALSYDYEYTIEHYDQDFALTHQKEIDLHDGWHKRELLAVYHFHGKIYLFTLEVRMKKRLLYVETVNKSTLEQNQDDNLIFNVSNLKGYAADFYFKNSRQEDILLVYSQLDVHTAHISDLNLIMFGKDLEILWDHTERILFEERSTGSSIVKISENGNAFILSLIREEKFAGFFYTQSSKYSLLAITENGKNAHQYPVYFPRYYIHGVQIEPGKNHDLSIMGFYSPQANINAADGFFYIELNNRLKELTKPRFYEFDERFLKDAMQLKSQRDPKQLYYFNVNQLIRQKNGDFLLLAENQRAHSSDTYRNILAACMSPGGILKWKKLILKRQHYDPVKTRNHSSYCVFAPYHHDRVYLIFNDNPKNREWPDEDRIHAFNGNEKSTLKVIGINPDGILSSSIIYEKKKHNMKVPIPLKNYVKLPDEIVIPAIWWNEFSFFKIRINE